MSFLNRKKTYSRKVKEAFAALLIERTYSKDEILALYLNKAYFGDGYHGVEAASLYYFKKPASRLTATEASRLIAVLPDPEDWRVVRPGPYVTRRTFTIAARLRQVERDRVDSCVGE